MLSTNCGSRVMNDATQMRAPLGVAVRASRDVDGMRVVALAAPIILLMLMLLPWLHVNSYVSAFVSGASSIAGIDSIPASGDISLLSLFLLGLETGNEDAQGWGSLALTGLIFAAVGYVRAFAVGKGMRWIGAACVTIGLTALMFGVCFGMGAADSKLMTVGIWPHLTFIVGIAGVAACALNKRAA